MWLVFVTDGTLKFSHDNKDYHLTGDFLKAFEGKEVLIDAGLAVFRGGKLIGTATPVK